MMRVGGFILCALAWFLPTVAHAQTLPLPDSEDVANLREALELDPDELARGEASAASCVLADGVLQCEGLTTPTSCSGQISTAGTARNVIVNGPSTWWVADAVQTDVGWILTGVAWTNGERLVFADGGVIGAELVRLEGVSWQSSSPRRTVGCPPAPERAAGDSHAAAAHWQRGSWRLEKVRSGPWRMGDVAAIEAGKSGFLPPTVRATADAVEGQLDFWLAPFASLVATGGSDDRIAAGAALVTRRREEFRRLDLLASWDVDAAMVNPVVLGDLSVGEHAHLRAHLEHPAPDSVWALRRLEQGGLFREWRHSEVGFSLSGPGHALDGRLAVLTAPALLDDVFAGDLRYATTFQAAPTVWDVTVDHESVRTADTIHSSTAAVQTALPIGSRGRAFVAPSAAVVGNFGAVTAVSGFDASTTISILGAVHAGLAFEGRFDQARHRIAPALRLGAELYGVQQRAPEEGAPPFPYQRPTQWRYASFELEHSLHQRGWDFLFPTGVFTAVLDPQPLDAIVGNARPYQRLAVRHGRAAIEGAAVCAAGCEEVATEALGSLRVARALTVFYGVSSLGESAARVAWSHELLANAATAVRLVQPADDERVFGHFAGIAWRTSRIRAGIDGRWSEEKVGRGLTARFAYLWPAVGWGLGATAGWNVGDEEWAVSAGLALK